MLVFLSMMNSRKMLFNLSNLFTLVKIDFFFPSKFEIVPSSYVEVDLVSKS